MSDPLAEHIENLVSAAQPGPSGYFSIDLARVEMAFAAGGQEWLHYWLRFACFYGANPIELSWDTKGVQLSFAAEGPDGEELRALLVHRERGPRYLALGALAALRQGFTAVKLECPRATIEFGRTTSRLQEGLRRRDGVCRLWARRAAGSTLPSIEHFVGCPVLLNGQHVKATPGRGLRLVVDGAALAWDGPALVPPGHDLDWRVQPERLDARLLHPVLSQAQQQELQLHVEENLTEPLTSEAREWLLIRLFARQDYSQASRWLSGSIPTGHPLAPALAERRAWLEKQAVSSDPWRHWPADCWPELLHQGLVPFGLRDWLRSTCARLPARETYAYLLRHSWLGNHLDSAFLQILLNSRRDTLGGNTLLAEQLLHLRPAQRPAQATAFCRDFLRAARQEVPHDWKRLSAPEQAEILDLAERLQGNIPEPSP